MIIVPYIFGFCCMNKLIYFMILLLYNIYYRCLASKKSYSIHHKKKLIQKCFSVPNMPLILVRIQYVSKRWTAIYLALYSQGKLGGISLFVNYIVNKRRRIINIVSEFGIDCCRAIPDYTSAFYGIGKAKAFNILRYSEDFQKTFTSFGNSYGFNASLFESIELFVCAMYGVKCSNTSEACYSSLQKLLFVTQGSRIAETSSHTRRFTLPL